MDQEKSPKQLSTPPSIFKKYGLYHPILEYKTPFDKSNYSSLENVLRGAIRSFAWAYGAKAVITFLLTLIKFKQVIKNPLSLIQALISIDNLKLGCFGATFTGVMKAMIVLTRIIRQQDDGLNGFVGGFLAGWLSFFFLSTKKKGFLACYMLARAFDCYYNHLVNKGVIKKHFLHYTLIFALGQMLIGYTYCNEPYLSGEGMNNFGDKMTNQNTNEWIMYYLRQEMTRRKLTKAGVIKEPYLIDPTTN